MVRSLVVYRCVDVAAVDAGSAPIAALRGHHCIICSARQRGMLHHCTAAHFDPMVQLVASDVVFKECSEGGHRLPGNHPARQTHTTASGLVQQGVAAAKGSSSAKQLYNAAAALSSVAGPQARAACSKQAWHLKVLLFKE